tara:strand:- start:401 stop:1117 length:717 start_codon:yes stop_codon:yes gene_type:complete
MKKNFLVIGGTKGLGYSIAEKLSFEDHKIIITGRSSGNFLEEKIEFLKLDLNVSTKEEFFKLISQNNGFDGVTFAQRYRPINGIREYLKEIKIMVVAISYFMEALRDYNLSKKGDLKFTRIIVVGSNYSSKVGKDQGWEYHTVKSAQLSLVKYFSVNSENRYSINLVSPATYVKRGAKEYWESTELSEKWLSFPAKGLLSVDDVADAVKSLLLEGNKYISGNNIHIDGGLFNLYADQV